LLQGEKEKKKGACIACRTLKIYLRGCQAKESQKKKSEEKGPGTSISLIIQNERPRGEGGKTEAGGGVELQKNAFKSEGRNVARADMRRGKMTV